MPRLSLLPLLLAACAAPTPATPHVAAETVTITENGLLPGPTIRVPRFGAVLFQNATKTATCEVTVDRPLAPTKACSTTLGFAEHGLRTRTEALPPRGIASLCFHDEGTFPFAVVVDGRSFDGAIVVGGRP